MINKDDWFCWINVHFSHPKQHIFRTKCSTSGRKACQNLSFSFHIFCMLWISIFASTKIAKKNWDVTFAILWNSWFWKTILISAFQQSKLNEKRCFWEDGCVSNVQNISSQLQTVLIMTNNIYCFEEERENICGHSWVASWMDRPV